MIRMDYRDVKPIHVKVKDEILHLILTSAILPGEALPSVRMLASRRALNPAAVERAYMELYQVGIIEKRDDQYVVASLMAIRNDRVMELLKELDEIVSELLTYEYTKEELEKRIGSIVERSMAHDSDK